MIRRGFRKDALDSFRDHAPMAILVLTTIASIILLAVLEADFKRQEKRFEAKLDSLQWAIVLVRDSAGEEADRELQANNLWWMHRCEEDALEARASADSALRALVRSVARRSHACPPNQEPPPKTPPAPAGGAISATITTDDYLVVGPSLY